MKYLCRFLTLVCLIAITALNAAADGPCSDVSSVPTSFSYTGSACKNVTNFTATPLIDGSATTYYLQDMVNQQTVSLYGLYGNTESPNTHTEAAQHYSQGITLASQIMPRCADGTLPGSNGCDDNSLPRIVFLFIGFSNCDVEICGGHADAWDVTRTQLMEPPLAGQACATQCPNLHNPNFQYAWNKAFYMDSTGQLQWDGYDQMSLLRQVYPDSINTQNWLVGPDVVVFDGALGGQTLEKWDPTSIGYYSNPNNTCDYNQFTTHDPECNYTRVQSALVLNGYTEAQVQAVFIKSGDSFPTCSMYYPSGCLAGEIPDAYQAETYLGDVLRYLKCCKQPPPGSGLPSLPRYPDVKQVFVTSRIYGGYANGSVGGANACLNPEPFAYELGFTVQRAITAQIRQTANPPIQGSDPYSGQLDYTVAPWVDWGPYLWASRDTDRGDGLFWCGGQGGTSKCQGTYDVLQGDLTNPAQFGDFTHPNGTGVPKVASQLLNFMNRTTGSPWVTPWIGR